MCVYELCLNFSSRDVNKWLEIQSLHSPFFPNVFFSCSKSDLTLAHDSEGMARSWGFKDKLMLVDPLESFIVLFREVEAVLQRARALGSQKSGAKMVPVEITIPN